MSLPPKLPPMFKVKHFGGKEIKKEESPIIPLPRDHHHQYFGAFTFSLWIRIQYKLFFRSTSTDTFPFIFRYRGREGEREQNTDMRHID